MYRGFINHFDLCGRICTVASRAMKRSLGEPTLWLHRLRLRDELSQLDSEQLQDAGINPEWVGREAAKPFWKE